MMEKKYDSKAAEQKLTQQWEQDKIYSVANNPCDQFSIDTPPPTVSGSLHIGHIFSYTQTDIDARYKRMSGYSVFYPFGFDDNGLPTEKYVEKKCKVRPYELGRSKFIELCLEQTKESEQEFKTLWQKIGLSVDWNYSYSTISKESRRLSQLSFIKLYNDKFIYRKDEPALYCTSCRTTVAQAELDAVEKPSFFNDIIFKSEDGENLIVGTTRPELLYSTSILMYHPDDRQYQHLKNKKAFVPVYNTKIPILEDELVDPEKGTGLVMASTFGDQNDVVWYKKHGLPLRLSIGLDGKWVPESGITAGLKTANARAKILEELKNQGLLVEQKPISHITNVHERCKKEIEYIALTQWFVNILDYKKKFLALADEINWYPSFMKSRYINWVENVKWDWCISRQRFYGIPFPVWHCQDCDKILLADEKDLPIDPQETAYPGKTCSCGSSNIVADTDVMDTWNTSSISPYLCYNLLSPSKDPFRKEVLEFIPMGIRPQAHDIIRTWAFYTIIKTWMHNKSIPWKGIVISGHVLSDKKEKLSKSKGNDPLAPENLLQKYSADIVRFWTASGGLGQDISYSEAQIKIGQRLVTKLWNAFRFAEPHIQNVILQNRPANLGIINEWLLTTSSELFEKYTQCFEKHEFGLALQAVEPFFWADFCDNYLELIKNQLFNPEQYSPEEVEATKWTLYHVGLRILQLYAPYLPYITDSIYEELYRKSVGIASIHQTKFKEIQELFAFEGSKKVAKLIINVVSEVRKLKTNQQLSLKTPLAKLVICASEALQNQIKPHEQLIKGVTQAEKITYETVGDAELKEVDGKLIAQVAIGE